MSEFDMLVSQELPDDYVLDSIYDIEEILETIAKLERSNDHFDDLKKYRTSVLNDKISNNKLKIERLRKVILDTMVKLSPDDKMIDFSPIAKIVRRKALKKWKVSDDEQLIGFLKEKGLEKDVVKTEEKIIKSKLKKTLDSLSKKNEIIPGAVLDPGDESISITYDKTYKPKPEEEIENYSKNVNVTTKVEKKEETQNESSEDMSWAEI